MNPLWLRKYERLRQTVRKAEQDLRAYKKWLATVCDHPEHYTADYAWEHDNGYGRQTKITGKFCGICGAKKAWGDNYPWRIDAISGGGE